ncbi:hypothetical protein AWH48_01695 [Domibacillus aminovorans]|uniref:Uncharacterized protein n=1 Tax=Domibacillus aminovorans TaxID=29332 RepID=A0A177KWK4_9BACI|nr:hypothetical protein [Domibacillus aminovorans]OAH57758.1 hypothetical protein AWH48_01695 [Domibacillus aminovorans]
MEREENICILHFFNSKAEADYYLILLADTDIEKVEVQPVFEVIPSYPVTCYRCNGLGKGQAQKRENRSIVLFKLLEEGARVESKCDGVDPSGVEAQSINKSDAAEFLMFFRCFSR